MKNITLLLTILFNTMMSASCKNNAEEGLLWEISGNGLTEKSYLFGTWHGYAGVSIDFLDSIPNFYKVFDTVSQYAGENAGNKDVNEALKALKEHLGELWMPQDLKYYDLLNKPDIQFLDSLLQKYIGVTSSEINIRPNHLFFTLSTIFSQKSYMETQDEKCKVVMDHYLQHKAQEKKYSLVGLDSPETTKRLLMELYLRDYKPGMNLKENADALIRQTKELVSQEENEDLKKIVKNMQDAYRNMDLKKLVKLKNQSIQIAKELLPPDVNFDENYHFYLIERNKLWMEKIPALINDKPTFIAVGALHLYGKQGLIQLLREKGYTVKPVN